MLHWPLNCPHRVENRDSVNVSLTTEHYTKEIRTSYAVNYANGLLRKSGAVAASAPGRRSGGAGKDRSCRGGEVFRHAQGGKEAVQHRFPCRSGGAKQRARHRTLRIAGFGMT